MSAANRRQFMAEVGRGMLVASVGSSLAMDMGFSPLHAAEETSRITFGNLDPLVDLLQATPVDKLLPLVVGKLKAGTSLKDLTGAAALANARAFAGEDYIGFHTLMALGPALGMAAELPAEQAALPVLKVLYRNTDQIQKTGGPAAEKLKPLAVDSSFRPEGNAVAAQAIADAVHRGDRHLAEQWLAQSTAKSAEQGLNDLLPVVEESTDVHRVVLIHRAWDMLKIVGPEQALSMLRQSLGYCLKQEQYSAKHAGPCREALTRTMDQFKLESCETGVRSADDKWMNEFVQTLFTSSPVQAAEAVGAAIAEGMHPQAIAEAISLTANQLVLRDSGRPAREVQPGKPLGSVHGDSIGVHASDTAGAWRGIALCSNRRNSHAALVLAGFHVAQDRLGRGADFQNWQARPLAEHLEKVTAVTENDLLAELKLAVEGNLQDQASAVVAKFGTLGFSERKVQDVLLAYAISQDGALHAEKYYRTTSDDFKLTRPSLRWRHLIGLARVTASEYGTPAPGFAEAKGLLGV